MTTGLAIDDPAYFDRLADVEARHWWSRGVWSLASYWLDSALAGRTGLRALDVGCGAGQTTLRLSRRAEVAEVVGLDPSPHALRHAKARQAVALVRGSALDLPFQDARFDLVTCFDVFQHLPPGGDRRAAREVRRVLSPGGFALIRANGRGWSGDDSSYRLGALTAVLDGSGLHVRRATLANAFPSLWQEVRGRLGRGPSSGRRNGHPSGGGLQIQVPPRWRNRLMGAVAQAEAYAAGRLGVRLPFGHSTMVLAEHAG